MRPETRRRAKHCKRLIQSKSRGNASGTIHELNSAELLEACAADEFESQTTPGNSSPSNVRLTGAARAASRAEVEAHDQVGEPLRLLWGKVRSGLPPALA